MHGGATSTARLALAPTVEVCVREFCPQDTFSCVIHTYVCRVGNSCSLCELFIWAPFLVGAPAADVLANLRSALPKG